MIKNYIKLRKVIFYFYLSMIFVLVTVNYLYSYPMESVVYSITVITFLWAVYLIADYMKYASKMKYLYHINEHLSADRQPLPNTDNSLETEYQKMISALYDIIQNHIETMEKGHSEQVEYYTMWVHQIKTPISAMRLILQNEAVPEGMGQLEQELFKIEQYVELALHYTKMSSLSSDLVIREYPLEEIVNQSIKKYAQLFIYKRLSLQIRDMNVIIVTDSKWLSFILEQILSNAIKYTSKGGISIGYENNTLRIADTGIGIREEDIERLFEKGYTGYNGRLDKKASGIGLYLTKKVADSLSIKISISSKPGIGTTVLLTFPVERLMPGME